MGRKPNTTGIKVDPENVSYDSMVFYITWYNQLAKLRAMYGDDMYIRGFEELCEYSFHGVVPDNSDNPVLEMFFDMARASIDANIKYRLMGKKGSEARWNKDTEEKPEAKKRGRKKKDSESITDTSEDDEGWIEPTPENIARSLAGLENEKDGTS